MSTLRIGSFTDRCRRFGAWTLWTVPVVALVLATSAFAADYYVDSVAGNDLGSGSELDPWQSLSMINGRTLAPGDRVFLKRGSVFRERLIIGDLSNGTAAQPIVVDAYGDDAQPIPVISGGELIPVDDPGWQGPGTYGEYRRPLGDTATYYTCCPNLVRADPTGIDTYTLLARALVIPFGGGPDLATALSQLHADSYLTNIESSDGRVLYYKPPAGTVPQDFEFEFSKRNSAMLVLGDHVEVRNVESILNNTGHPTLDPPVVDGAVTALGTGFTISDCKVAFGRAFGIAVYGADSLVDGCIAEHNNSTGVAVQQTAATGTVVRNNIVRFNGNLETGDLDRGGIATQSSHTVIRDNVIHDNGNISDNTPPRIAGDGAITLFEAHDLLVEGNFIYNSARSAIQASRGPQSYGQRIVGNVIYNWNLVGPACDPAPNDPPGDCQNSSAARSAIALFGFDNPDTAGLFDIQNNTIYSDQADVWLYGIQLGVSFNTDQLRDSRVLNNIVHMPDNTDPRSVGLRATRSQNYDVDVEIDYNDIYLPLTPGPNNYATTTHGIGPDIAMLGEPEYEIHSLHVDPDLNLGLANPADPARYDLLPGSPVIDAGIDVGRTEDFLGRPVPAGAAPDMGAFESPVFCIDDDFDGICDDVDLCPAGPLAVNGFLAPMGALAPAGEDPVAPDTAFKANRTLPLKLTLTCNGVILTDLDVPPPTISEIARDGEALDLPTADVDSGDANDDGLAFRFSDDAWIYNLGTRGLEAGSYVLSVTTAEGVSYAAAFFLR